MNSKYLEQTGVFEGFSAAVYRCPAGFLTIGYGHNLEVSLSKEVIALLFEEHYSMSRSAALDLLEYDMQGALEEAPLFAPGFVDLSKNRQYILVDMCFNMGLAVLSRFHNFQRALRDHDWECAADEMVDSRWYRQVGNRSKFLVELMRTDSWPDADADEEN